MALWMIVRWRQGRRKCKQYRYYHDPSGHMPGALASSAACFEVHTKTPLPHGPFSSLLYFIAQPLETTSVLPWARAPRSMP